MFQLRIFCENQELQGAIIPKTGLSIGRDESNDLVFPNLGVSRHHARITMQGDTLVVQDLNSTNGVYVNEEKIEGARSIKSGDQIQIGKFLLQVVERDSLTKTSVEKLVHHDDTFIM